MAFWKKRNNKTADVSKTPIFGEVAAVDSWQLLFGKTQDKAVTRYNPSALITRKGMSIIDKIRHDDQVKAAMNFKKNIVTANGWEVVSPKGKDESYEPRIFIEQALLKVKGSLDRKIYSMLTALDYGFSVSEQIWDYDSSEMIFLSNLKTKKPYDIYFSDDGYGNLTSIKYGTQELPVEKFIVYTYDMEFENFYGNSDLLSGYRSWWTKDNSYKWLAILLEKMGIPPIFAMYDPSSYQGDVLNDLRSVLQNLSTATVATIPRTDDKDKGKSIEFWTPELAKNVGDVFVPAIEMLNKDIARSILVPDQLGATSSDGVGSYAKSQTHFDVFMLVVEKIRNEIQDHIIQEQIVKPLIEFNFDLDEEDYPEFRFIPLSNDKRLDVLTSWKDMIGIKAVKNQPDDEDHIRTILEFPDRDPNREDEETAGHNANNGDQIPTGKEGQDPNKQDGSEDVSQQGAGSQDGAKDGIPPKENTHKVFTYTLLRPKNDYERKIDFAAINKKLTDSEVSLIESLRAIVKDEQSYLIGRVRAGKTDGLAMRPSFKTKFTRAMKDGMLSAAVSGKQDIMKISKFASIKSPGTVSSVAEKWVIDRASDIAGITSESLKSKIAIILSNAIRAGTPLGTIVSQIEDELLPYIGNDNIIDDEETLSPNRIETIVRTNTQTAFNQGRLAAIRDPDVVEQVAGVEYSAIMDSATTDICSLLDGRVFKVDDPDLDRLTPPNHFNCRSILVPIMIDEVIKKEDFLSSADKGRAFDLAGKGFV